MRIIEKNEKEKIKKCNYCGSIFAYKPEDIINCIYKKVLCPVCKNFVEVSIFDKTLKEVKK